MALPNRYGRRNVGSVGGIRNRASRTLNTSMSRGSFLRTAGMGAAGAIGAGLFGSGMARAAPISYDFAINAQDPATWPSGSISGLDAVQKAVDAGGKILLVGTFQFGFNRVVVGRNGNGVEIYGAGDHATKIMGGAPAFVNTHPMGAYHSRRRPMSNTMFG